MIEFGDRVDAWIDWYGDYCNEGEHVIRSACRSVIRVCSKVCKAIQCCIALTAFTAVLTIFLPVATVGFIATRFKRA